MLPKVMRTSGLVVLLACTRSVRERLTFCDSGFLPFYADPRTYMPDLPSRGGGWSTLARLCFCEKYGKLARTDLKNERISRSGCFQACYEIIRRVGGWSESRPCTTAVRPTAFFEEIAICGQSQNRSLQPQAESGSCVVLLGHLEAMMGPTQNSGT
jgi:hypothetical protein